MKQVIINYLFVVVIPFLMGLFVRILFRRRSKAWFVTAMALAAALIALIVAMTVPNHGSELYGLRFIQAACLMLGSVLSGIIMHIKRKKRH